MELNPLTKGLPPSQGLASICFASVIPVERGLLPRSQIMESWARQGCNVPGILPEPLATAAVSSSEALARWPGPARHRTVRNATLHPCSPRYLLDVGQNAVAIHKGVPRCDALVTSQHLEGGGFARSVEAKKAKAFPFADRQGDPVHRQQGLPAVVDLVETNTQAMPVTARWHSKASGGFTSPGRTTQLSWQQDAQEAPRSPHLGELFDDQRAAER